MANPTGKGRLALRALRARAAALPEAPAQPEPPPKPDPAPRISELVKDARANWYGLLSYLAFVGIALLAVEDADFFIPERQTELPLIGVSIPTALFFAIAPGLGAMLYINLHLYLMKLWRDLARADPKLDGDYLSDRISPWLVADFALAMRADGALRPVPLRTLSFWVTLILVYLAAPMVIAGFWWRSMPAHDELLTCVFIGVPLFATVYAGVASYLRLRQLLRRGGDGRLWPRWVKGVWSLVFIAVALVGWFRTEGTLEAYARTTMWWDEERDSFYARALEAEKARLAALDPDELRRHAGTDATGAKTDLDDLGYLIERLSEAQVSAQWWMRWPYPNFLAIADLSGAILVETPEGWLDRDQSRIVARADMCRAQAIPQQACGPPPSGEGNVPAFLAHQRIEWCKGMFAPGTPDLTDACAAHFAAFDKVSEAVWAAQRQSEIAALPDRVLAGRDLRNASLLGAQMEGADLSRARLEGARLARARLEGAYLFQARLEGASLWRARLEGADLWNTRLQRAFLREARLEGAKLLSVRLEGADLTSARLAGAYLQEVRLEGADLRWARLEGVNLIYVGLSASTSLQEAILQGAAWRATDLSDVTVSSDQLNATFGDGSVILPGGKGPDSPNWPTHWPKEILGGKAYYPDWRDWQASIGYTPPGRSITVASEILPLP